MRVGRRTMGLMMAAVLVAAAPVLAQKVVSSKVGGGGSPHDVVEWSINGATITLNYGRPFVKGRPIAQVAPIGKAYRTGADEATTITTDKNLMFNDLMVPPGTYTLYTLPVKEGTWQLIVSKQTGQWGTEYNEGQDLGRTALKLETAAKPSEQLTIDFEETKTGRLFTITWGTTRLTAPFMVH